MIFKCNPSLVYTEATLHSVESHWRGSPPTCVPTTAYQALLRCQERQGLLFAQLERGQGLPVAPQVAPHSISVHQCWPLPQGTKSFSMACVWSGWSPCVCARAPAGWHLVLLLSCPSHTDGSPWSLSLFIPPSPFHHSLWTTGQCCSRSFLFNPVAWEVKEQGVSLNSSFQTLNAL